jgi:hypothetical protein
MNKSFGLGRAHEVLIWDLDWLERCELLLMIGSGKQTQKKVEESQANAISKQQEKKSGHGFAPRSSPQRKERGIELMFKDFVSRYTIARQKSVRRSDWPIRAQQVSNGELQATCRPPFGHHSLAS